MLGCTHLVGPERDLLFVRPRDDFQTSILHIHVVYSHEEGLMVDRPSMIVCPTRQLDSTGDQRTTYVASI